MSVDDERPEPVRMIDTDGYQRAKIKAARWIEREMKRREGLKSYGHARYKSAPKSNAIRFTSFGNTDPVRVER